MNEDNIIELEKELEKQLKRGRQINGFKVGAMAILIFIFCLGMFTVLPMISNNVKVILGG